MIPSFLEFPPQKPERGNCYGIAGEHEAEGEFSFGISITRTQSVEQNLIDQTVIELFRLCGTFNGDYEGWETPVIAVSGHS
jgi:regulator of RNase E activity RraB